ncbi:MAG: GNAT family N-acetyltransferase [Clostridia bacterium]|nr:GNAT family N-acetyltransferase [Clostridia bacterium]
MYDENFVITESDGLVLTEMTEGAAREISSWRYGGEYSMYDLDGSAEEVEQVMNGLHFPVYESASFDKGNRSVITHPVGFVAIGPSAQVVSGSSRELYGRSDATDIAIGLRPDLCGLGKGLGQRLTGIAVNFVLGEFPEDGVRLAVAAENKRAVKVYEKFGFKKTGEFTAFVKIEGRRKKKTFLMMEL